MLLHEAFGVKFLYHVMSDFNFAKHAFLCCKKSKLFYVTSDVRSAISMKMCCPSDNFLFPFAVSTFHDSQQKSCSYMWIFQVAYVQFRQRVDKRHDIWRPHRPRFVEQNNQTSSQDKRLRYAITCRDTWRTSCLLNF
jgi:hypothetical protein